MPIRTINLKMILGSKDETKELRQALWATHKQINSAVAEIERVLLLCRGKSYWMVDEKGDEVQIPESQVVQDALVMAREAQRRNGKEGIGSDKEILSNLRMLYEQVVPSCRLDENENPIKGNAQSIGSSYAGPLFDFDTCSIKKNKTEDESGPFSELVSKKLEELPGWITEIQRDVFNKKNLSHFKFKESNNVESFYSVNIEQANDWYQSKPIQNMLSENKAFNKDGWKKKKFRDDDTWVVDFAEKQLDLIKGPKEGPKIKIRETLWKKNGLLPIGKLFFDKDKVSNLWNRLAARLAVAHLLSWESWNHNTKKEYDKAVDYRNKLNEKHSGFEEKFTALRQYEAERHAKLHEVALADDDKPFKIGIRAIRAWDRVREEWNKNDCDEAGRRQVLKDLQTKLRRKFGDSDLFLWLASSGREHLWKETDALTPLVKCNEAARFLERKKKYSLMTFADARKHPRWAMYEAPGGTNLRKYEIKNTKAGIEIKIPLLVQGHGQETWEEKSFSVRLASNGQFLDLQIEDGEKKKKVLKYRSAHQDFQGIAGGAELLFDRSYMENDQRTENSLRRKPGPVWFKLTLDVKSQAPEAWLNNKGKIVTPPEVHHFKTALANKSKHIDKLMPGLRVLSVDLGLRNFASCSVFELVQGKPQKGLCFPAADGRDENDPNKFWAKHERSFQLTLPGEIPNKKELAAREKINKELHSLKSDIGRLKSLLHLGVEEEDSKRDELISKLLESCNDEVGDSALNKSMFTGLGDSKFKSTSELWRMHCQEYYKQAEQRISQKFSDWRKRTRPKSSSWDDWRKRRDYNGGKSIWMLDHLDKIRKLILNWNFRAREYGKINRQNKKQFGTVASGLLHHINQLKKDRIKSGTDLIIQAARGFIPVKEGKGWVKKYEPCRLVLFEDLARYRFRVDRPRWENSQLMKWSHRGIIGEAIMQAELYDIVIETTAAGFSSRFLAGTGAPGVRCRYLMPDDFESDLPKAYVVNELEWLLGNTKNKEIDEKQQGLAKKIQPGILVPWSGGELFASIKQGGGLHFIHADINAAQNLQRRFWGRCGEAFRIVCKKTNHNGADVWELEKKPGVRLLGALQQLAYGDGDFYLVSDADPKSTNRGYRMKPFEKRKKFKGDKEEITTPEDELEEQFSESDVDFYSDREVFFRDPSNVVLPPSECWIPSKEFWSTVKCRVWRAMSQRVEVASSEVINDIAF